MVIYNDRINYADKILLDIQIVVFADGTDDVATVSNLQVLNV